ncbi:MAG: ABC transporter ATP-binding protein, partial [Chloroflexi bacterium]|nr:ABC transporter ATP-binding protein [Chloroflexota bacterium]
GGGGGAGGGGLGNLPIDLIKIIAIVIAMFALSPGLTLIVLATVPVVYLVSSYFRRNVYRVQLQVRRTVGSINAFLQETFSGMRIVKSYGKEEQYDEHFQKPLENNLKAANSAAVYDAYFPVVMQVIRVITVGAVVWFGARTGVNERLAISIGALAAMADLVGRLYSPIEALAMEFQTLQRALAGLKRISELLVEKPEEKGVAQRIPSVILPGWGANVAEIRGLSFSYQPGKPVLRNVSFSVPQGRKIAIVGRTGAGKTTLMNLVAGLYPPDEGAISVLGYNPFQVDPRDRRKLLGVVPQNVHIFEGTIRENIALRDGQISLQAVEKAARTVGLHEHIMGLEKGYDTVLGVGGTSLSFGQSQLLSMARAIVSDPALLLLDEPTSGMDAVTEAAIFKAFREISRDRSIITISHRLSGVIDADEVHIMASGRIVQSGTPEKLAGESGWYSVFHQLEALGWKMD